MENNSIRNTEKKDKSRDPKFLESLWAYALLSWLTATFPAIMLVPKLYAGGATIDETTVRNVQFIVIGLCSFGGAIIGAFIGLLMALARQKERILPMILAPFFGGIWGIVIGGLGGFPLFFIGGIFLGWIVAVPLGFVGFSLFAVIYESLAARRRLRWWQIVLIAFGVVSFLLIGVSVLVGVSNPFF